MTPAVAAAAREKQMAARRDRLNRMLQLVGKRYANAGVIARRTGWHERSTQRYAVALEHEGLITRTRDNLLDTRNASYWRYSLTDAGRRAISAG